MSDRKSVVIAFCEECVWARAARNHFRVLFESGEKRHELLEEVAKTFFQDLHNILIDYIVLQMCKLTDAASSGKDKENLTSNYLLSFPWNEDTKTILVEANRILMQFREKVVDTRRKLIAHSDLKARAGLVNMGAFTQNDEDAFWEALQTFANAAHTEAFGGPIEIDAQMPDGDAQSLVHALIEAVDYSDVVDKDPKFLMTRLGKRRFNDA